MQPPRRRHLRRGWRRRAAPSIWDGTTWSAITLPGRFPPTVEEILIEGPDKVWMVGSHGLILVGNAESGLLDMGFDGDQQTLLSITRFQGRYIVASNYELHEFDGHMLSTIKPTLRRNGRPTPFKVQAVDDVMFYFDDKQGVHRWEAEELGGDRVPEEPASARVHWTGHAAVKSVP